MRYLLSKTVLRRSQPVSNVSSKATKIWRHVRVISTFHNEDDKNILVGRATELNLRSQPSIQWVHEYYL